MGFKDKELTKKIIERAFKIHSILGKEFLENERMILNVIFKFILSILLILSEINLDATIEGMRLNEPNKGAPRCLTPSGVPSPFN